MAYANRVLAAVRRCHTEHGVRDVEDRDNSSIMNLDPYRTFSAFPGGSVNEFEGRLRKNEMVKCKRKTSNSWTENEMHKAIKVFREGRSQRHAAELLGVPHSYLQRGLQSGQDNHLKSKGRQTTFTPKQENELVSRILKPYT
ncbi:hypothetical protein ANN_22667 [Periplaneta americana]|uniref:HTH psq-type domain-containing protein n=1 Tax=Periplaneta americana TaxID=6978 RepID=A0ABQ8S8U7_PERAM|nr:hypothetical protein ANN_22667 [Periplaneta americana]